MSACSLYEQLQTDQGTDRSALADPDTAAVKAPFACAVIVADTRADIHGARTPRVLAHLSFL